MPDTEGVKISLLPSATSPADADVLAGVQGNVTKKFSLSALKTFFLGAITPASIGAVPDTRTVNGQALDDDITLDADDVGAAEPTQVGSISLSSSWSGSGPYSQTVTVTGVTVTANSKVDLQPTAAQIASLISAGVNGMVVENNNGTLTLYSLGNTPSSELTIQVTVTEVTT